MSLSPGLAWRAPSPIEVPVALSDVIGGHPLVAQVLARRGLTDPAAAQSFIDPAYYSPTPPGELPDLLNAVDRLDQAISQGEQICVWGDFDVDGQTATAVLISTLRSLGGQVRYYIPNRKRESHGIHLPALQQIIADGVQLLVTCDTGITAHESIAYAQSRGVDVILTDHHLPSSSLPQAVAVLDPHLLPDTHHFASLPGVGVAYLLALALLQRAGSAQRAESLLDLVALGIVADVAELRGETRYLLQRGLSILRRTQRTGLRAIFELADLSPADLTEEHIAFELAPRLNAAGRLDDASLCVELLTTADLERVRVQALQIEALNEQRKLLTSQVLQGALAQIKANPALLASPALVISHPSWHTGVLGPVASQLAEQFHRPTILIATPPSLCSIQPESARGSARSIPGVDITAALTEQSHLLIGYGGHRQAAGLSLRPESIDELRRLLGVSIRRQLGTASESGTSLQFEAILTLPDLTLDLSSDLERLAPYGAGFPPPLFLVKDLRLVSQTNLGRPKPTRSAGDQPVHLLSEHRAITVEDQSGNSARLVWWQAGEQTLPSGRFDLACTLRTSCYSGQPQAQIELVAFKEIEDTTDQHTLPPFRIIDHRQDIHPYETLDQLRRQAPVEVWAEAQDRQALSAHHRLELKPALILAIWTTPPGFAILQQALEIVQPSMIHLFARPPETDDFAAFVTRLAGLVKYTLNHQGGQTNLPSIAAACAQTDDIARLGLEWLQARGDVLLTWMDNGQIHIKTSQVLKTCEVSSISVDKASGMKGNEILDKKSLEALILNSLAETAAFRANFSPQKLLAAR